ncbi:MAG: hypothetical protein M3442_00560 [Chloroflexota bacterium]|nr:hypothetical protein [Chloroflexota bacterium]
METEGVVGRERKLWTGLSKPDVLMEKEDSRGHHVRFHRATDQDLSLVEALIAERLRSAAPYFAGGDTV